MPQVLGLQHSIINIDIFGRDLPTSPVAQSEECLLNTQEVPGSKPGRTNSKFPNSSAGRASD